MTKKVLALDVEGTLISNAVSQFPRPRLFEFLEECRKLFERVCVFTTVPEDKFRRVAEQLVNDGAAPSWFENVEYVQWRGKTKDLSFVENCTADEIILVDDVESYVHPRQEKSWVKIDEFVPPFEKDDGELERVLDELRKRKACPGPAAETAGNQIRT